MAVLANMQRSTAVLELEVTAPFPDFGPLHCFADAHVLLRLHGRPLGFVTVPVESGCIDADTLLRRMLDTQPWNFAVRLAERALAEGSLPRQVEVDLDDLLARDSHVTDRLPTVTVAVCTRDRTVDLKLCLDALGVLEYPGVDVLVVDNAPTSDATERLVRSDYPDVRYVREPRPGLDWARNRAILECRGDILAYTDDDVVVDRQWVTALARVFAADPEVMAVTGLVIPHELETDAQRQFERYGGFGRGFQRWWYRAPAGRPITPLHGGTGKFGTGANMAFRRRIFDEIGGFDPALDVGTCTNGGGDLEMFFRVLKHGHTLVYEPSALVRHRHRREPAQLRSQIANNGIGFYSYLVRTAWTYPDERVAVVRLAAWWFRWWNLRRFARGLLGKETIPLALITGELRGSLQGLGRYRRARRQAGVIAARYPAEPTITANRSVERRRRRLPEAVRQVDVSRPLQPLADATAYERLQVLVSCGEQPLGVTRIEHHGAVVSAAWLGEAIAQQLTAEIVDARTRLGATVLWANLTAALARRFAPRAAAGATAKAVTPLAPEISVSIVIATCDRPLDLSRCLKSLTSQRTARRVEIVVVDNHPASGLTKPVVDGFAGVTLVEEARPGLSYARNRGIDAATGDIIICTDDDVVCPPEWVERLLTPFRRSDVMVVTGNVLPLEIETEAQRLFELYGGLGRGFTRFVVDAEWFRQRRRSVPTWELGCTANAAFRASIFSDPAIGGMDEALGAGTPSGCSEDTYVFYRVLKAGYAIAYEPQAYVWHCHRRTMAALRKQIYSYSKGHVAYHLTTWLRDGDRRGLVRLLYELPQIYLGRTVHYVRGFSEYPLSFIGLEILGTMAGPFALWRSRRRVRRLGSGRRAPEQRASAIRERAGAEAL
jgi:GT2 family glycosyltransferase